MKTRKFPRWTDYTCPTLWGNLDKPNHDFNKRDHEFEKLSKHLDRQSESLREEFTAEQRLLVNVSFSVFVVFVYVRCS